MKLDLGPKRSPFYKKRDMKRRDFLRYTAFFSIIVSSGIVIGRFFINRSSENKKILVTENCVGCTGCVSVCPTLAIEVVPGGIEAFDDKCISCGYCQTSCAVDGIRVLKANGGAV